MKRFAKNRMRAAMFKKLLKFSNWLAAIPNRVTPPPFRLIQMGSAYWQARALHMVTQWDIASLVHHRPQTVEELAQQVVVDRTFLERILQFVLAHGIFEKTADGRIHNNPVSEYLNRHKENNVRAMVLLHQSPQMIRAWMEDLPRGAKEGIVPFQLGHGKTLFEYMDHHPEYNKMFSEAMNAVNHLAGDHYAEDFDWSRFERVIDIGGSEGSKSAAILHRHPGVQAVVCDRAVIVEEMNGGNPHEEEIASRLSFQHGDLFGSLPVAGVNDVYLLSAVLHAFDDDECIGALKNIKNQSGTSAPWVVVMEMLADEPMSPMIASFDLQMLVCTRGKERNLHQWNAIFENSGYSLVEVVPTASMATLLLIRGNA
jgi:hypothetical protein